MALVVCTHAARCEYDPKEHWALQDASIAATLAHLAIVDLGLATCWVGAFLPGKVAAVIGAAKGHVPLAMLPIGYADEVPQETDGGRWRSLYTGGVEADMGSVAGIQ